MAHRDETSLGRARGAQAELPPGQYKRLVEHSPVLIWRSGTDGACDYFNDTWLEFTGRTLAEELGDGWTRGVHEEDLERCVAVYRSHFERRAAFEMEYRLRRRDGAYRWIFDRGVPFHDDDGKFQGFIGSCIDVHERREVDEAKSRFLAMMAHEQRTPLTAMQTFLEVVRRRLDKGRPFDEQMLARLQRSVDDLTGLVQTLTDAARLDAGLLLSPAPLDVGDVVQEAVEAQRARCEPPGALPRGHELVLERDGPMPVLGDSAKLRQAFAALLDNAVKFSPRGGRIHVRCREEPGGYRISIADPGVGIPEDERLRIGRRFFRARNALGERFPGIGVGFALAKAIVELHDGYVEIDSELGRGTTVSVVLPGGAHEPA